jgi:hypothetical protein
VNASATRRMRNEAITTGIAFSRTSGGVLCARGYRQPERRGEIRQLAHRYLALANAERRQPYSQAQTTRLRSRLVQVWRNNAETWRSRLEGLSLPDLVPELPLELSGSADVRLLVSWEVVQNQGERELRLDWRERGPVVTVPKKKGFGHRVMKSMV